ncbi:MAG: AhpC/TSA family protein [Bacteroidales bacterium]|nr:AhpC/TSA family protein [Bacteroidales bacterium]
MKKIKFLCFIALALFSAACSQKNENICTFNGVLENPELEGKKVYLYDYADKTLLDSAVIESGHFTFADTVSSAKIGFVQTERTETARYYLYYIMEPGTVYGDLVTDSLSGTPLNDAYYKYQSQKFELEAQIMEAAETASLATPEEAEAANALFDSTYNVLLAEFKQCTHKFYEDNKDNVLGVLALETLCEVEEYNVEQFNAILADASPIVRDYPSILKKVKKLQQMENTSVGKHYIDVDILDSETGKMQKLSDYIEGKVALIDFWASWCGPCRRAIPYVAEMYSKYAGKGLTVIGLNVWDSPEKQAEIIKAMNMNWIQIADTTSENIVSTTYSVEGIPHIMLIDANGTIVARNLDENTMEKAIKEALELK